jgi:hypothetical protein
MSDSSPAPIESAELSEHLRALRERLGELRGRL